MINTTRHYDYIRDTPLETTITLVGCGSIGTILGTTLARLGFSRFILIDADIVEEHNIANQYFTNEDLGKSKVAALEEKLLAINEDALIETREEFLDKDTAVDLKGVLCVCTDNMDSRKFCYKMSEFFKIPLLEGRMGGVHGQAFFVHNEAPEGYQKLYLGSLYSDEEAQQLPCTARTILFTPQIVSSLMAQMLIDGLDNMRYKHVLVHMAHPLGITEVESHYMTTSEQNERR